MQIPRQHAQEQNISRGSPFTHFSILRPHILADGQNSAEENNGQTQLEDWVTWIKRATRDVEKAMREHNVSNWTHEIARRKFRWAGHIARRDDGRWTKLMLQWSASGRRCQGRPCTRWSDSINKYFSGLTSSPVHSATWIMKAQDREYWKQAEEHYIKFCRLR